MQSALSRHMVCVSDLSMRTKEGGKSAALGGGNALGTEDGIVGSRTMPQQPTVPSACRSILFSPAVPLCRGAGSHKVNAQV